MKVRISDDARAYLLRETAYLRKLSPAAAKNFSRQMKIARRDIGAFTNIGFESEELPVPGMRRLIVGDYLLDYEVGENEIHIVAVRHGRQLSPDVRLEEDFDYEEGLVQKASER